MVRARARVGARPSHGDRSASRSSRFADVSAEPDGGPRRSCPNEDMGEFTVHLDAPEGTSPEGTTEIALEPARGAAAAGRRGACRAVHRAGAARSTHIHFVCYLQPLDERKVSQGQVVAGCGSPHGASRLQRQHHRAEPARRRRERGARFRRTSSVPTWTSFRVRAAGADEGEADAEPHRRQTA